MVRWECALCHEENGDDCCGDCNDFESSSSSSSSSSRNGEECRCELRDYECCTKAHDVGDCVCSKCETEHNICEDCGARFMKPECPECSGKRRSKERPVAARELLRASSSEDSEADWEELEVHDYEEEDEFRHRVDWRRVENRRARRERHAAQVQRKAAQVQREAKRAEQEERTDRERERKSALRAKVYGTAPDQRPREGGSDQGQNGCSLM